MSNSLVRPLRAVALALAVIVFAGPAAAQQKPTPAAVAMAKEILVLKGAATMWDPVIPNVIERARTTFLQTNVALAKELDDVANQLRAEYAPRTAELTNEIATVYATRFTEAELKELVAFYKSPVGKKVIAEEPQVIDASAARVLEWGNQFTQEVLSKMRAEMKKKGHDL
jgi:hypothetical protein